MHDLRVVEELVGRTLRPVLGDRVAGVDLVGDRLPVDRVGDALTEFLILEPPELVVRQAAVRILVEGEKLGAQAWTPVVDGVMPGLLAPLELGVLAGPDAVAVGLPLLEEQAVRVLIGGAPERESVDVGRGVAGGVDLPGVWAAD